MSRKGDGAAAARLAQTAPLFFALGEVTRLGLVAKLCSGGPQSITRLTPAEGVTRQAITKHLRTLEAAGVVQSRRQGRERVWQLETARLEAARRQLDHICQRWDEALSRARDLVEQ